MWRKVERLASFVLIQSVPTKAHISGLENAALFTFDPDLGTKFRICDFVLDSTSLAAVVLIYGATDGDELL